MSISRVLIGGGTGFIGSALTDAFKRLGMTVTVVSRMPTRNTITWENLKLNDSLNDIDAVINVSGQNVLDPMRRWTPKFQQNVIYSRVETNQILSNAIRKCSGNPPKVFVTISGVGFYPPDSDQVYDEDSKGGDHDFLSRLCRNWEKACEGNQNTRTVAVRTGVVLGANGGMVKEMYPLFCLGLGSKIGPGNQFMPWIHLHDLTQIFVEAIQNDNYSGVVNAVAPQIITNQQFTKAFGRALRRPAVFTVPEKIIQILFGHDRAVLMTKGQKVISKRLPKLNYEFKFDNIDAALKQIVADKRMTTN